MARIPAREPLTEDQWPVCHCGKKIPPIPGQKVQQHELKTTCWDNDGKCLKARLKAAGAKGGSVSPKAEAANVL